MTVILPHLRVRNLLHGTKNAVRLRDESNKLAAMACFSWDWNDTSTGITETAQRQFKEKIVGNLKSYTFVLRNSTPLSD